MPATYDIARDSIVDRIRRRIGDTDVNASDPTDTSGVVWQDAEIEAFYADNGHINPANKREWWTEAEMLEALLVIEGRLIGKVSILGYSADGSSWRAAAQDRIRWLRQRHVLG